MDPSVRPTAVLVLALLFCALRVEAREGRFFSKIFGSHHSPSAEVSTALPPVPASAPAPAPVEELFVRTGNGYGLYGRDDVSNEIESAQRTTATQATGSTDLEQNKDERYTTVYEKYGKAGSTGQYTGNEFEKTGSYGTNSVGLDNEEEEEADEEEEEEQEEEEKLRKASYRFNSNEAELSGSSNNGYAGRNYYFSNSHNGDRYTQKSGLTGTAALGAREGSVGANSQNQRHRNNNQKNEFDSMEEYERLQDNNGDKSSATSYPNSEEHSNKEGYSSQQSNDNYNRYSTRTVGGNDEGSYHGSTEKSQNEFDSMEEYDRLMGNYNPSEVDQP